MILNNKVAHDGEYANPLLIACASNRINIVRLFLPSHTDITIHKLDVNTTGDVRLDGIIHEDMTPMHVACYHNNVEMVGFLLRHGAEITAR